MKLLLSVLNSFEAGISDTNSSLKWSLQNSFVYIKYTSPELNYWIFVNLNHLLQTIWSISETLRLAWNLKTHRPLYGSRQTGVISVCCFVVDAMIEMVEHFTEWDITMSMDMTGDQSSEREEDSGIESSAPEPSDNTVFLRISVPEFKVQVNIVIQGLYGCLKTLEVLNLKKFKRLKNRISYVKCMIQEIVFWELLG